VKKVSVIGAGPSGITAAKNCIQNGLDVTVFEKNDKVGGNWVFNSKTGHSSVYENTHLISSKAWSEYEDFPMPYEKLEEIVDNLIKIKSKTNGSN
jgi:cation diffusion facilitator CzcD-associated flavoprotein CzcO